MISEEERRIFPWANQFGSELIHSIKDSLAFKLEEAGLECPDLENN